ncbi:hypothetical protein [Archangium primigenium]|uniref:hypothetical protein n=1 Tax=[Archangium] primigenium TaxID=2792470 RepID=UPI00195D6C74|nr:hypothetical protein [Archangium primigenium]MBM7115696.1 hypothetical protein [Archangium primigenium]
MNPHPSAAHAHRHADAVTPSNAMFRDVYLQLLRPDCNGLERLHTLRDAIRAPYVPGGTSALERFLTTLLARPVRLSDAQRHAFECLAESSTLATLSPWSGGPRYEEVEEMVSASDLHTLYLALLKPDGGLTRRFKALQAATALYEPGTPGSREALDQEISRLAGRSVRLSEPQLRCLKELLVDEPAFAHIAPWEDLTASW